MLNLPLRSQRLLSAWVGGMSAVLLPDVLGSSCRVVTAAPSTFRLFSCSLRSTSRLHPGIHVIDTLQTCANILSQCLHLLKPAQGQTY